MWLSIVQKAKMSGTNVEDVKEQELTDNTLKNEDDGDSSMEDLKALEKNDENPMPSPQQEVWCCFFILHESTGAHYVFKIMDGIYTFRDFWYLAPLILLYVIKYSRDFLYLLHPSIQATYSEKNGI